MTQSSYSGYVLRTPATAFSDDEPVSSYRAWENRQNLLHLTDESAQHRINWVSPDASGYGIEATPEVDNAPIWSHVYPHTFLAPGKPANLDLYVQGHDCIVIASLVPYTAPLAVYGGTNLATNVVFTEILDLSGATPTSATFLYDYGASGTTFDLSVFNSAWAAPGIIVGSDGIAYTPLVCLMRLDLQVIANTEDPARVFGVCLREYA